MTKTVIFILFAIAGIVLLAACAPKKKPGAMPGKMNGAHTILRLPLEVSPLFQEWLGVFAPNRAKRIMNHIRTMNGGKDYDPHWSRGKEIRTPFAQLIALRYRKSLERTGIANLQSGVSLNRNLFRVPSSVSGQGDLFDI